MTGRPVAALDEIYQEAPRFSTFGEVEMGMEDGRLEFGSPCWYWVSKHSDEDGEVPGKWLRSTAGRVLFNSIIPDELGFLNHTFGKKELGDLIFACFTTVGLSRTTEFLDHLKDFGFRYATMGGVSVGIADLEVPEEKLEIIHEASEQVARFQKAYTSGYISNGERYNKVIDTWTHANNDVADAMVKRLARSQEGFNPVYMMMTSSDFTVRISCSVCAAPYASSAHTSISPNR